MKRITIALFPVLSACFSFGQVGIGTISPNSTLEISGSMAAKSTISSATSYTLGNEINFIYTGSSAATVTLPDAAAITGRLYTIKNASSSASLTVNTTSSQTIDGITSQVLGSQNQTITVVSNGSNWFIIGYALPNGSSNNWSLGGNSVSGVTTIGTNTNYDLPFVTNNSEKMRLTSSGNLGIGTSGFSNTNPEKLLIDAGSSTSYQNVIVAKGNTNSYAQFNIQNTNGGGNASSDIVATANNGNETSNYVDLGINSSNYNNGNSSLLNGGNIAYLYNFGQDFVIGNASPSKSIIFFTGGDDPTNEKFRINSTGFVMTAGVASNIIPSTTNTYNLGSSTNRWNTVYSNNSLNTSDARLKTNIRDLDYGLSAIMRMRSVKYNWKEGNDRDTKIGFLAQDLRKILPEVVVGNEEKENLAVNYIELIPVLVNAIKEQQVQIQELQKKVKALEHK